MDWKKEWKYLAAGAVIFLAFFYLPIGNTKFEGALLEAVYLTSDYAREHILLCLLPAFFIAGAIGVFISQASVMKYLGAKAKKVLAYGVASVSGSVLAVCSCTILPLFAGIYKMGAGLGPATAFLYSGPAINVLAIVLTARVLGFEMGIARALGAVIFSIVIGLLMHLIFIKEETKKATAQMAMPEPETTRPLWQNAVYFATMVWILVFANWGKPVAEEGIWYQIHSLKWIITAVFTVILGIMLVRWFGLALWKVAAAGVLPVILAIAFPHIPLLAFTAGIIGLSVITSTSKGEMSDWFSTTWSFAKQITPLLFAGVIVAGFLLGRPGHEGLIPSRWVEWAVGGNSILSNFFASFAGALMYFATLTEVPILQGLIGSGMGKGPALALLLAGPALSLPNMLVIRSIMGTTKTLVYISLVVIMATISGIIFGTFFG